MVQAVARPGQKDSVPGPVAGMLYQAVVAPPLLYGSETWVLPPLGLKCLEGFHVEATRRLTGMRPRMAKGKWVYAFALRGRAEGRLALHSGGMDCQAEGEHCQNHKGPQDSRGV